MNNKIYYPLEENSEIIKNLFGKDFLNAMINDKLNINDSVLANDYLAEYLYGTEISSLLKINDIKKIKVIVSELQGKYNNRLSSLNEINLNNYGMIVIRPENIGLVNEYIAFLEKYGLQLIYSKKTKINFEQYLLMYQHGLIIKESRLDFPTRTLNYINKDCIVLIFKSGIPLRAKVSDYLNSIKGKPGIKQNETLRGGIAYNYLKNFVNDDGITFKNNDYNLLFDPIGMCRLLVRGEVESDHMHDLANLKILHYVGQAVHVPNSHEIMADLSVLLNENEIDIVHQKTKKR